MDSDSIVQALLNGPDVDGVLENVRREHELELQRLMDQQATQPLRRTASSDSMRSSASRSSRLREEPEARRPMAYLPPPPPPEQPSTLSRGRHHPLLSPATEEDDRDQSLNQMTYSMEDAEHWLPPPPRRAASTGSTRPQQVQRPLAALIEDHNHHAGTSNTTLNTNEVCMSSAPATPTRSADDGDDGAVGRGHPAPSRDTATNGNDSQPQPTRARPMSRVSPVITPNRSGPVLHRAVQQSAGPAAAGAAVSRLAYYHPQLNVSVKAHRARQALLNNYATLAAAPAPPPPDPSFLADDGYLSRHFQQAVRNAAGDVPGGNAAGETSSTSGAAKNPTSGPSGTTVMRLDPFLLHAPYAYAAPPEEENDGPPPQNDAKHIVQHATRRNPGGPIDGNGGDDGRGSSSSGSSGIRHGLAGRSMLPSSEFQQRSMEVEAEPLTDEDDASPVAPRRVIEHQQHRRATLPMQGGTTGGANATGGGAMHGKFRNSLLVVQTPNNHNHKRNGGGDGSAAAAESAGDAAAANASVLGDGAAWMSNQVGTFTDSTTVAVDYFENSTSLEAAATGAGSNAHSAQQQAQTKSAGTAATAAAAATAAGKAIKGGGTTPTPRLQHIDGTSSSPRNRSITTAERRASPLSSSPSSDASYSYSYSYGSESDASTASSSSVSSSSTAPRQRGTARRVGAPTIITPSKGNPSATGRLGAQQTSTQQQRNRPQPKPTNQSTAAANRFQAALRSTSASYNQNRQAHSLTTPTVARSSSAANLTGRARGGGLDGSTSTRRDVHQPMLAPRRAMSATDLRSGRGGAARRSGGSGVRPQQHPQEQSMRASMRFGKPPLDTAERAGERSVGQPAALAPSGHHQHPQEQGQMQSSGRFPPPPPPPQQQLVWESSGHVAVPSRFTVVPPSPAPSSTGVVAPSSSAATLGVQQSSRFIPPPPASRPMPVLYRSQSSGSTPAMVREPSAAGSNIPTHRPDDVAIAIPHYQPRPAGGKTTNGGGQAPAAAASTTAAGGAVPVAHITAEYHGRHATFSADAAAASGGNKRGDNFAQRRFAIEVVQQ